MKKTDIILLAGIPDDDNRDYLPERLKESRIVVNENGNNSQVYPQRLKECRECLVDDFEDVWYEYVPESYRPDRKTPLVFSMHGGLMTGWGQAVYTSWTHVADREGFICVFPNAQLRRFWTIECEERLIEQLSDPALSEIYMNPFPKNVDENHDVRVVFALIERMKRNYNIDPERIYMQGMSLGNAMTTMMARHYGFHFAAMAGSAGPGTIGLMFHADDTPNNEGGPLPVMQTRMELDGAPPGSDDTPEEVVVKNREYWCMVNGCTCVPEIKIVGENNLAFYKGKKADYIFRDVKNRDHGQTFDDAEFVWDYLFSGTRRKSDGRIEYMESLEQRRGDNVSFAAVPGSFFAWANNEKVRLHGEVFVWKKLKYHGLNGKALVRGEYPMAPVRDLAEIFKADCREKEGKAWIHMPDGRSLQFARGCIGCTINNRIRSMSCEAVEREGILYISSEWFCREICRLQVSECNGVIYATDHDSALSSHMARLIRDLLK